jgi:hypothetical protein
MGRPLDEITYTVTRRPGAWDGAWTPLVPTLTVQLDGDPTPKSTATVDDVTPFVAGEYAQFYDSSDAILGYALIVSIAGQVITFTTDSLTWDAEIGDAVMPALRFKASRPQPVGPDAIDFLEEGARTVARYVVYAQHVPGDAQPLLYSTRDGFAADTLVYNDKTYKVSTDDDYRSMPLGYHAYILIEYGDDEEVPVP